MSKPKAGRPAFYKTPEELQAAVDRYFDSCKGTPVFDKRGLPVMIRPGVQKMAGEIPPTLAGLSHFLGYRDRQQFTRQRRRSVEFANVVALARLRVENYAESRLYDLDGYKGAAFVLKMCFGWQSDDPEPEQLPDVNVVIREPATEEAPQDAPTGDQGARVLLNVELMN